jgi:glycosyltransferase involved in cell wall biosynthesis
VPAVTVIIPAYNAESHIGDALASVREQTFRDLEVLVVDDGSRDGTVREAERFAGALDLTVIRQANAGPAAARNHAIRLARGRYCAFLDADDVMLSERLSAQVAMLDGGTDIGLVHSDLMTFNEGGIIHRSRHAFSNPCGGMVLDRLLLDNFITTSTVMAPRQRLLDVGLFGEDRRISEDFELWLRMAARWRVGFIDQPLVQYRRRLGSLSDNKVVTALCALDVVEKFWREHPQHRRARPRVYRQSIAEHLTVAGTAALAQGDRRAALGYLLRSLRLDPRKRRAWKTLAKALVRAPRVQPDPTVPIRNEGSA